MELLGISSATIYNHLALERLHPDLLPFLDPPTPKVKRLGIQSTPILLKTPKEYQVGIFTDASKIKNRKGIPAEMKRLAEERVPGFRRPVDSSASSRQFRTFINRIEADLGKHKKDISVIAEHMAENWTEGDNISSIESLKRSSETLLALAAALETEQKRVSKFEPGK